ncbi:hypothetical protein [Streptomyces sp. ISL-100]|uniref:hypothetical protein n=1 Tax=Streptomyces sp. ISL-100 TaxID=2819173 RepID=UPI001BEB036A|nr:hypothetical protein [Streptomyces sp. ISL-100]MBT2401883.1 hypothetical protein [Streptomyces sp. ISL-100]
MSHRATLRTALFAAVAAAAVLVPSTAAFASDATPTPTPKPEAPGVERPAPSAVPTVADEPMPRGGVAAGDKPSAVPEPASESASEPPTVVPRGGVAAGERTAGNGSDTTSMYGTAIGAVLLAGAGTVVMRRRTAAHRNN